MTVAFRDLRISDARVTEVVVRAGGVLVRLQDWRGHLATMTFDDVIAFVGIGAIDADLSHARDSTEDPLICEAAGQANEGSEGYRRFPPISAWNDEPLLKVVTRRAIVAGPREPVTRRTTT